MFLNPNGHLGLEPLLRVMYGGVGDAWLWALLCPPSTEPCPSWLWHWGLHPRDGECAQMGVGTGGLRALAGLGPGTLLPPLPLWSSARLRWALQARVSDSACLCKEGEWQGPQGSCPLQPTAHRDRQTVSGWALTPGWGLAGPSCPLWLPRTAPGGWHRAGPCPLLCPPSAHRRTETAASLFSIISVTACNGAEKL